ncbi:MAG: hypothetical protein SWJ54_17635 [Cyanobacteriota bacterium]|nr:hypothetical protein [Cyanobacteriota bacterium]
MMNMNIFEQIVKLERINEVNDENREKIIDLIAQAGKLTGKRGYSVIFQITLASFVDIVCVVFCFQELNELTDAMFLVDEFSPFKHMTDSLLTRAVKLAESKLTDLDKIKIIVRGSTDPQAFTFILQKTVKYNDD